MKNKTCNLTSNLYSPRFEHDACGIGAVVDTQGRPSHETVDRALKIVEKLEHRAGKDASGETGDGVGILVQISHRFFSAVLAELGVTVGQARSYAVGMFFLPQDRILRARRQKLFEILAEKAGLGYYSRVRNLQKAARIVCEQYGGQLPADYDALRALPGIGDYTAGAIASISFGIPVPAVDGNVLRVFSRLYNDPGIITEPAVKKAFTARVMEHQPPDAAGDYNQALMELGALVCVPNGAPLCEKCPLAAVCRARAAGTAPELPHKAAPKPRRTEPVTLALLESPAGFLLQQRPAKGLLAGLWQPVLWEGEALAAGEVLARLRAMGLDTGCAAPDALPAAKHIFSHIEWHMSGILLHLPAQDAPAGCVWASREALQAEYTLPGAFKSYKKLMV